MQKSLLQVNGMSCQHCVNTIEKAVKEIGGVAEVDLINKAVTIEFDENRLSLQDIRDVIEDKGFSVV